MVGGKEKRGETSDNADKVDKRGGHLPKRASQM